MNPLRYISNQLGAAVGYDSVSKSVYIDNNALTTFKSENVSIAEDATFQLKMLANKTAFKYGEPITVWTEMNYLGKESSDIYYGGSMVTYSLTDADGFSDSELGSLVLQKSKFNVNDAYMRILPQSLIGSYLMHKNNVEDPEKYLNEAVRPAALPIGTYTLKVSAEYGLEEYSSASKQTLSASMTIVIE
ncbi:copper amine oxidase domain protein [Paenibacillus curdlanolyticus YK9]|uniref:Copper amine oxidase domain protein n=1 Tax=Paenibacillus curdlanolyticus YK9 TaxID=717606 RepID=E0IG47_9BACL|nr:hypothetical protein [Paenibacillus curdlanolyticus]EFM08627.1 copper amine oxidase domain protein [Paenibacillus curdlanolyticus YK9]